MIYIILISLALIGVLILSTRTASDYAAAFKHSLVLDSIQNKESQLKEFENEIYKSVPELSNYIGQGALFKLFLPALFILTISIAVLGPSLTNPVLGLILGTIIALAYIARIYYHQARAFRSKLLLQLERILISIRNNLSTGMVLDYAVGHSLKFNQEAPLGPNLARFIKIADTKFLEHFPLWLKSLQKNYRLKELAEASQLLKLELRQTHNQEEAFINAAQRIAERIKLNQKQQNTIMVTFITMDFMILAFLGVLFFIIPGISVNPDHNWWNSTSRVLSVFISGSVLWGAYLTTVLISLWRQA
jgi:Flp pilus assembly protein TadB